MSCENYFGKRTDLDFIEIPTYDVREISYVPIAPNINDAQSPVDVHAVSYTHLTLPTICSV